MTAIEITGAELADWLERAAGKFYQLSPDHADQPLINPALPGYNFDLIDGAEWNFDLSQPARYNELGVLRDPAAQRVRGLRVAGRPVAPADRFLLATNDYRLGGPGLYAEILRGRAPVAEAVLPTREVLRRYIARRRIAIPATRFFGFTPLRTTAIVETSPRAMPHLHELSGFAPEPLGLSDAGFLRLRLHL